MSEEGKAQGATEQPDEEQNFLRTLYRVLPKLVSGLEMPTSGPSPLLAQEPAPSPDKKETQDGIDPGGDQEERLRKAQEELNRACWGLYRTISKFEKVEKRIHAVEGGVQLMDALVRLRKVAGTPAWTYTPGIIRPVEKVSNMLVGAFKNLGEGFIKDKHLAPLHELSRFCRIEVVRTYERKMFTSHHDLGKHIDYVTKSLSEVFESELPGFLKAREKALSIDYNNMLTAATFFSAVTATTLQLSYTFNTSPHVSFGVAVNTLWFVALVFSTASSLNSLVGLTWYQKIRRNQLLPNWVKLWIEYGPMISLAVASAAFSAGLSLFAFSSSQHTITSALTASFTVVHAIALFAPLCLYSPNSISRFLLKAFTRSLKAFTWSLKASTRSFRYFREVCLRWWYLRRVPQQDRDLLRERMRYRNWTKADVIKARYIIEERRACERRPETETRPNAATSLTGDVSLGSGPIGAEGDTKVVLMYATEESGNMEQAHEPGDKVDTLSKIERDIESQGDVRNPGMQGPIVIEDQDIVLSKGPRMLTLGVNEPDKGTALATNGPGKKLEYSPDTPSNPESTKEPTAATFSTADPITGSGSTLVVSNPDNDLESGVRQAASTSGRPDTSRKDEQKHPFSISAQKGVEAYNIDASNPASNLKVGHKRRVTFEGDRPTTDVGSSGSLK